MDICINCRGKYNQPKSQYDWMLMKRINLFLILTLTLSACSSAVTATQTQPSLPPVSTEIPTAVESTPAPEAVVSFQRGINFGNMLEAPNEGEWGVTVQENYFDLVNDAGFDFVRLPVRWNAHADESAPYAIDPVFFARVDEIVNWALARDLIIIVDFHHYEEMFSNPWGNEERFLALWTQIAEHYKDYPSQVMFELLNEPFGQIDAAMWNGIVSKTLSIVRQTNPTRDVIVGPVQWNSPDWLSTLDLPNDPHLIATFHYYSPFEFTHQGAEWAGDEAQGWLGNTWDGTAEQKADVTRTFDAVSEWAARRNVRILLGEFGAYSQAPMESRVRWTSFIREQAEARGFAWAYWEFGSGFGAYAPEAGLWRDELLWALIP